MLVLDDVNDAALRHKFFTGILPVAIESIEKDTNPAWGKMSSQHMIEHLLEAFEISTGKLQVQCRISAESQRKFKAFLHTSRPMPKGFRNPLTGSRLPALKYGSLEEAVERLNAEVQNFFAFCKEKPEAKCVNPTFGELNVEEWQKFHFKHCLHHLSQFGG
ncbi:MAG TPA: DinB family protein [Balneolaceae bacterium]